MLASRGAIAIAPDNRGGGEHAGGTMKRRQRQTISLLIAAVAVLVASAMATAQTQTVAMITDLSGKAAAQGNKQELSILAEIESGARISLESGARLVAIYLRSGEEYAFAGPAQIQFQPAEPYILSGAKPQKRASPLAKGGKDVTIKPVGVTQAGFVMRSGRTTARIKLLSPSGTTTFETSPEFRWVEIEPGLKYRFELTDETGKSLYEADVSGASLRLPDSLRLRDGAGYTWELTTRLSDGRRYVGASDFSVASADLRAQAEALRPAAAAPVSARVAFAAWLDQMELKDEARKYWKTLAAERPDDARLRMLAGE